MRHKKLPTKQRRHKSVTFIAGGQTTFSQDSTESVMMLDNNSRFVEPLHGQHSLADNLNYAHDQLDDQDPLDNNNYPDQDVDDQDPLDMNNDHLHNYHNNISNNDNINNLPVDDGYSLEDGIDESAHNSHNSTTGGHLDVMRLAFLENNDISQDDCQDLIVANNLDYNSPNFARILQRNIQMQMQLQQERRILMQFLQQNSNSTNNNDSNQTNNTNNNTDNHHHNINNNNNNNNNSSISNINNSSSTSNRNIHSNTHHNTTNQNINKSINNINLINNNNNNNNHQLPHHNNRQQQQHLQQQIRQQQQLLQHQQPQQHQLPPTPRQQATSRQQATPRQQVTPRQQATPRQQTSRQQLQLQQRNIKLEQQQAFNSLSETPTPTPSRSHNIGVKSQNSSVASNASTFHCDEPGCGKSFPSLRKLRHHKVVHSDEFPFVCAFQGCNKKFKRKFGIDLHSTTHFDLDPDMYAKTSNNSSLPFFGRRMQYSMCKPCGQKFKTVHEYQNHMLKHGKEPFKCPVKGCGQSFTIWKSFQKHRASHYFNYYCKMDRRCKHHTSNLQLLKLHIYCCHFQRTLPDNATLTATDLTHEPDPVDDFNEPDNEEVEDEMEDIEE